MIATDGKIQCPQCGSDKLASLAVCSPQKSVANCVCVCGWEFAVDTAPTKVPVFRASCRVCGKPTNVTHCGVPVCWDHFDGNIAEGESVEFLDAPAVSIVNTEWNREPCDIPAALEKVRQKAMQDIGYQPMVFSEAQIAALQRIADYADELLRKAGVTVVRPATVQGRTVEPPDAYGDSPSVEVQG